jgi:hypothetical protein
MGIFMPTFEDAVEIIGDDDVTQLTITGNNPQTNPLQIWQTHDDTELARLTGDGRFQIGSFDSGMMATDESLIEAHRHEDDTTKPKRGFHLLGTLKGTLDILVAWIVHELILKGTSGISALHSAMRVRLRNEVTGMMGGTAELRGGDVEVVNAGGTSGSRIPKVSGLRVGMANEAAGYIDTAYGIKIEITNAGASNQINKVYALYTDVGIVHLGGEMELPVLATTPSDNPPSNFVKTYVKLESGEPQLYSKDSAGVERVLGGGGNDPVNGSLHQFEISSTLTVPTGYQAIFVRNVALLTDGEIVLQGTGELCLL